MINKLLTFAFLLSVAYCEQHSYSIKTVIQHEVPKNVEVHHAPQKQSPQNSHIQPLHTLVTPVQAVPQQHNHVPVPQKASQHYFVPAYHVAPVREVIVEAAAPVQYKQQPSPVKESPKKEEHHESHHEDYYVSNLMV